MLGPRLQRHGGSAPLSPHAAYDEVAEASASLVIDAYSSSFGLASRLLAGPVRHHVRNVYALVRVADEIVDAPRPDQTPDHQAAALATLEAETLAALRTGGSSNLVVHAFARTARHCDIEPALVTPFFASMRTDLERTEHDEASLAEYVYGSAEVVGLMCLRAFLVADRRRGAAYDELAPGAQRLGAAFQKVNFLRDLGEDSADLGRSYLPGLDAGAMDVRARDRWLDDIDADLAAASEPLSRLPRSSRVAVRAAHDLFAELSTRLRRTPAAEIPLRRVRVPGPVKARIAAGAVLRNGHPRPVAR
ncbi:phytoene/squalene synthase family protein [Nocardioides alkalitolerans]|uniref:phytoene/squalene synthase family protein n=1 Tax=Nocardioides alkalitolerans TaxID=281714 RepID=UPI0004079CC9|nr:squalene/phytoene synthase family protein [Nocardioides alkalitolerans]